LNIRVKRERASMGTKPRMHSRITLGGMRMLVTSRPDDELWHFFSLQGWREIVHRPDRRRYADLPRISFDLLARSSGSERENRYRQIIASITRVAVAAGSPIPDAAAAPVAGWSQTR
jgi:hypothetical protein